MSVASRTSTSLGGAAFCFKRRSRIASRSHIGIGPGFWTSDIRLSRVFRLTDKQAIDFLFEAFNLFNHLNYATVNNTVGAAIPEDLHSRPAATASQPLGYTSAFDPRRLQLGVRFTF